MSEEKENALTAEDTEKQLLAAMAEQMKLLDYVAKAGKPLPEGEKPASVAYSFDTIVGKSKELKQAITLAQKVAMTDAAVFTITTAI